MRNSHSCTLARRAAARAGAAALLLTCMAGGARAQISAPSEPGAATHAGGPVASDSAAQFARGCELLERGDSSGAVLALSDAVSKQPERLEYSLRLAQAYLAAGRSEAALRLLRLWEQRRADAPALRRALAEVHAVRREWKDVATQLAPLAEELDQAEFELLVAAQRGSGHVDAAEEALERGVRRFPQAEALWLAYIDVALEHRQFATALRRGRDAQRHMRGAALELRLAQAHVGLGNFLGEVQVRTLENGRVGQFAGEWLPLEERGANRFLCSPENSALYHVRRALDGGADDAGAHLLHARIWQRAGRAEVGLSVLRAREAPLLENPTTETLDLFAQLSLDTGDLAAYLKHMTQLAEIGPAEQRGDTLYAAYTTLAEKYNQRGDEALYVAFLRRAVELRPADVPLLLRMGDAEWESQHASEAARLYRKALELSPGLPNRETLLERIAIGRASGGGDYRR